MPSKRILILGATGASGVLTVEQALNEGHEVIVYARSPEKLSEETRSNPKLKIFKGELSDSTTLSAAFAERPDVVISLLGPGAESIFQPWIIKGMYTGFYKSVFQQMRAHGVKRIFTMGTISIYFPKDKPSFGRYLLVWIVYLLFNYVYREIIGISELFQKEAGDLDWTIFRLGFLGNGPVGEITAGYVGDGNTTMGIQRSEVAKWLVDEAGKENQDWIHDLPSISTAGKKKV